MRCSPDRIRTGATAFERPVAPSVLAVQCGRRRRSVAHTVCLAQQVTALQCTNHCTRSGRTAVNRWSSGRTSGFTQGRLRCRTGPVVACSALFSSGNMTGRRRVLTSGGSPVVQGSARDVRPADYERTGPDRPSLLFYFADERRVTADSDGFLGRQFVSQPVSCGGPPAAAASAFRSWRPRSDYGRTRRPGEFRAAGAALPVGGELGGEVGGDAVLVFVAVVVVAPVGGGMWSPEGRCRWVAASPQRGGSGSRRDGGGSGVARAGGIA